MEAVVVTGTRVQDPTVAESLSPIDVLPWSELESMILPYSAISPFGCSGRFVYGRLKYDF